MNRFFRHNLLLSLMAGASLVMACIVYAEIRARLVIQDTALPQGAAEIRVPPLPEPRSAMPAKEHFAEIVERPLFSPSRRPPAEEIAVASTPTLDFSLFGIVISAGEPFALVKPESGGDPVRITEGQTMSGWTVARIEADRMLVRYDTAERELFLDFSTPAPPPPEAAVPNDAPADGRTPKSANVQGDGKDKTQQNEKASQQAPEPEAEEPESAGQSQGN